MLTSSIHSRVRPNVSSHDLTDDAPTSLIQSSTPLVRPNASLLEPTDEITPMGQLLPTTNLLQGADNRLSDTAVSQSGTLSVFRPNDVYSFSIGSDGFDSDGKGNINLALHDISAGDDADLYLYRDSNANGTLDSSDALVASSIRGSNANDTVNVRAEAGNYFARVSRYAPGSSGDVQYQLDLSAARPSNLLSAETNAGHFSRFRNRASYTGRIDGFNTSDVVAFSHGPNRRTTLRLTGLSSDADIRVIRDVNNNKIFDGGDTIVGSSTRGGNASESITVNGFTSGSGNYLAQVYQYRGDTNYTLSFATV
jgi:hypothetical protein